MIDFTSTRLLDELQNLRLLPVVAEEGSFAGAARRLNCAASVIMRSIESLEQAIGESLLERHAAGVRLSSAGELVRARAVRIDAEIDLAAELFQSAERVSPSLHTLRHVLGNGARQRLVLELVRHGSARAAADGLGMTQPGISMALGRLERTLGAPLFERTRRGLRPSDQCVSLLKHINRIEAELRALCDELDSAAGDIAGTVVLGLLTVARLHLVPAAVIQVRRAHPRVKIRTMTLPFDRMLSALADGRIDLVVGVAGSAIEESGLRVTVLGGDELGIFLRSGHPLLTGPCPSLGQLSHADWIMPRREALSRRLIESCFAAADMAVPEAAVESTDTEFIRQLVLCSDMLAFASPQQFAFELQNGSVARLPIPLGGTARETALLERNEALPSPAVSLIRAAICEQANIWAGQPKL
ncbi:MAG: hypothetical protein ABS76_01975 [Pelagibacterium sp. SCN 64-44]|nr:MAG: hypothetical protein ABS76_01975 [Pelagibacterium sp. SCN 64-44]